MQSIAQLKMQFIKILGGFRILIRIIFSAINVIDFTTLFCMLSTWLPLSRLSVAAFHLHKHVSRTSVLFVHLLLID